MKGGWRNVSESVRRGKGAEANKDKKTTTSHDSSDSSDGTDGMVCRASMSAATLAALTGPRARSKRSSQRGLRRHASGGPSPSSSRVARSGSDSISKIRVGSSERFRDPPHAPSIPSRSMSSSRLEGGGLRRPTGPLVCAAPFLEPAGPMSSDVATLNRPSTGVCAFRCMR